MYDDREYRKLLGFANGNPNVGADIGNARVKMMTDAPIMRGSNPLNFAGFEHALAEINEATYRSQVHRYRGRRANHLIKVGDRYYVVGDEAYSVNPTFDPVRGRLKYEREYYGILFLRGIEELFGDQTPPAINAFVAHPPADLEFARPLMKSVAGKWRYEVNGRKRELLVDFVNHFDEIEGGVFNATSGIDGQPIDDLGQLIGGGPTLVFDLGGGSLDLARLKKDGSVDYDRPMVSERIGINSAINSFKQMFDYEYSELVSDAEDGIPRDMVNDIFMDKKHILQTAGESIDCTRLYKDAIDPLIRDIVRSVRTYSRGSVAYNRVLLTGGGSGLIYEELREVVFPKFAKNQVLHTADHQRDLYKANVKGGLKMLEALKQEGRKAALSYRKTRNG